MSYLNEKLIIGAFASFVETGTSYGDPANTVSKQMYPNADTFPEAWSSLGCILDSSPETEVDTDEDYCPDEGGRYRKETSETVVRDILKLSLKTHSEPIHRLILGKEGAIVDGQAFTPFAARDRSIDGWILLQLRGDDGNDRVVMALYGKLRLDAAPKWSKDPTKPAVEFEIVRSTIQTAMPGGITA